MNKNMLKYFQLCLHVYSLNELHIKINYEGGNIVPLQHEYIAESHINWHQKLKCVLSIWLWLLVLRYNPLSIVGFSDMNRSCHQLNPKQRTPSPPLQQKYKYSVASLVLDFV